ncbi:hypothetical protein C2E23DRAFT_696829, partial [Lenzites betulinus]
MLRITGTIISGSTALYVLDRDRATGWEPSDLDLYAPSHHGTRISRYLSQCEGYVYQGTAEHLYASDSAGFVRVTRWQNRHGMRIDLIHSQTQSALFPLPFFWSTHLMNYLTADSFCIAYPALTLRGRGLLNPVALSDSRFPTHRTLNVMTKYQLRGYDFR